MTLKFIVKNQIIRRTDNLRVVKGIRNYLTAKFTFSEEWAGLTKYAVFSTDTNNLQVTLVDDACPVPEFFSSLAGTFKVNVYAGDLITSNAESIKVEKSGIPDEIIPPPELPPTYGELITLANDANAAANAAVAAAGNAVLEAGLASAAASAAETTANTANVTADQANQTADEAKVVANAAQADADEAKATADTAKAIAGGVNQSIWFDTLQNLVDWLAGGFIRPDGKVPADITIVGTNIYIVDLDVRDRWVKNAPPASIEDLAELEGQKVRFEDYYTKPEADDAFVAQEAGKGLSANDFTNEKNAKLDALVLETITSTLPATLAAGTVYDLPQLTANISFALPTGTASGQKCEVKFSCGATPYTFTVTGTNYTTFSLTPIANMVYDVTFVYNAQLTKWAPKVDATSL